MNTDLSDMGAKLVGSLGAGVIFTVCGWLGWNYGIVPVVRSASVQPVSFVEALMVALFLWAFRRVALPSKEQA